jgi:hypothetical protein
MDLRVVAVNSEGREISQANAVLSRSDISISKIGRSTLMTVEFEGLTLEQIREFRLQARAGKIIEIPEVSLVPGFTLSEEPLDRAELDSSLPVVVETSPVSGGHLVVPGLVELRVRFSKEMKDRSWSWSEAWPGSTPEMLEEPQFDETRRVCSVKVQLEPDRTYAFWLNSENHQNFQDTNGRPAVPYLLIFETRERDP